MLTRKRKTAKKKGKKKEKINTNVNFDPNRIPIGLLPVYFRESGRVFIGCERNNRRMEMDLCIYKRCPARMYCPQFQVARKMKEDLGIPIVQDAKRKRMPPDRVRVRKRKRIRERESVELSENRSRHRKRERTRERGRTREQVITKKRERRKI